MSLHIPRMYSVQHLPKQHYEYVNQWNSKLLVYTEQQANWNHYYDIQNKNSTCIHSNPSDQNYVFFCF